jgi:formate transporter
MSHFFGTDTLIEGSSAMAPKTSNRANRDGDGTALNGNITGVDAYSPSQIAERVELAGVVKATMPLDRLLMLGLLAGAFIAFGAALYTLVMTGSTLGYGPSKLLGGAAFSLGLVLVVVGGAELFTGNNLIVMAWADGRVSTVSLLRNWVATFVSNCAGAILIALLVFWSGTLKQGEVGATAVAIAQAKMQLPFAEALLRGILCNALVCLAVWLSFAAHSVSGKILAIVFPITAFVALGFEHSVANAYLIPLGILAGAQGGLSGFAQNLMPVTIGNIIGGGGAVAFVYWVIYRRTSQ